MDKKHGFAWFILAFVLIVFGFTCPWLGLEFKILLIIFGCIALYVVILIYSRKKSVGYLIVSTGLILLITHASTHYFLFDILLKSDLLRATDKDPEYIQEFKYEFFDVVEKIRKQQNEYSTVIYWVSIGLIIFGALVEVIIQIKKPTFTKEDFVEVLEDYKETARRVRSNTLEGGVSAEVEHGEDLAKLLEDYKETARRVRSNTLEGEFPIEVELGEENNSEQTKS